jgi:outer membrane protein TolC
MRISVLQNAPKWGPVLLSLSATAVWGAETVTLQDALRLALERNVEMAAVGDRLAGARARVDQGESFFWPRVTASASQFRQTRNLEASGLTFPGRDAKLGPYSAFDARVRASQTVYDASLYRQWGTARAREDWVRVDGNRTRSDTLFQAAVLYLEARRAREAEGVFPALVERDQERVKGARARWRAGVGSPIAVQTAETDLGDTRKALDGAVFVARAKLLDLVSFLGFPSGEPLVFSTETVSVLPPMERNAESHPDLAALRRLVDLRRAEAWSIRAERGPRLALTADYGASGVSPADAFGAYTYGAQAAWPLWEGGLVRYRHTEARASLREAEHRLEDARRRLAARRIFAAEMVSDAQRQGTTRRADLDLAERELEAADHRYRQGVGTRLEWVEAKARRVLAEDRWREALARRDIAEITSLAAQGRLEELVTP